MLQLHLPPEIEAGVREYAETLGVDIDQLAIEAFQQRLAAEQSIPEAMLPRDKWKARLEAYVATLPKRETRMDDSRESIYGDDGR